MKSRPATKTHTPTPWKNLPGQVGIYHDLPNGCLIADCGPTVYERKEQEANAEFIVRAVNSHEELLEVVKRLRAQHHAFCDENNIVDDKFHLRLMDDTDKAIAHAQGEKGE